MKTTVIFHSADMDGQFCREIARKFLPEAELIGWDFADKPLPIPEGQIYVLDLPVDKPFGLDFAKREGRMLKCYGGGLLLEKLLSDGELLQRYQQSTDKGVMGRRASLASKIR